MCEQTYEVLDLRTSTPATFQLIGPSGAGKTTTLYNLLLYSDVLFKNDAFMQYVLYFYNAPSSIKHMKSMLENHPRVRKIEFMNECPTGKIIEEKIAPYIHSGGSTVIVDDWGSKLPKCVAEYFTVYSHHYNSVGFFLMQSLFPDGHHYRLMSRNAKHILIFKLLRDGAQFECFARQVAPGKKAKCLIAIYDHVFQNQSYGYLWFDFAQDTHPYLRIKSDATPSEWPIQLHIVK